MALQRGIARRCVPHLELQLFRTSANTIGNGGNLLEENPKQSLLRVEVSCRAGVESLHFIDRDGLASGSEGPSGAGSHKN